MSANGGQVLFLGAGASAPFGYPLTNAVFRNIWDCLNGRGTFPEIRAHPDVPKGMTDDDFDLVKGSRPHPDLDEWLDLTERVQNDLAGEDWREGLRRGLCLLFPGLGQSDCNPPSIIDVLSLIDHLLHAGEVGVPMFQPRFLEDLRTRLEFAILMALGAPKSWPEFEEEHRPRLRQLARWLAESGTAAEPLTVVSTNYDILVEMELYGPGGVLGPDKGLHDEVDFGFSWREPAEGGAIRHPSAGSRLRFFKLHGSLNWLRCPLCGFTFIQRGGAIFEQAFQRNMVACNCCWCGQGPLRPVIVAPSAVRQIRDANLLTIWQRALEALRTARTWYIIGYSLPPEDLAIRSILLRAYRGRWWQDRPTIYAVQSPELLKEENKTKKEEQECRYHLLFGPDCRFDYGGIEDFIKAHPVPA